MQVNVRGSWLVSVAARQCIKVNNGIACGPIELVMRARSSRRRRALVRMARIEAWRMSRAPQQYGTALHAHLKSHPALLLARNTDRLMLSLRIGSAASW